MAGQIDYEGIRKRVEKRIKQRQEYVTHLAAYIGVNVGLWGIWFFTGRGFPWPIFPMLGWGIAILIHSAEYFVSSSMDRQREDLIEREIRREKMRLYGDPDYDDVYLAKPKRRASDPNLRLSDDGEIVADDAESDVELARTSRQKEHNH